MKETDDFELIHGSGNVFRDFGDANADALHLRAMLAACVISSLNRQKLSVRRAETKTGIAAADFSRIRNANLTRFTIDRLMIILDRLGEQVDVMVTTRPVPKPAAARAKVSRPAARRSGTAAKSASRS